MKLLITGIVDFTIDPFCMKLLLAFPKIKITALLGNHVNNGNSNFHILVIIIYGRNDYKLLELKLEHNCVSWWDTSPTKTYYVPLVTTKLLVILEIRSNFFTRLQIIHKDKINTLK